MLIIHGDDVKRSYESLQQVLANYRLNNTDIYSYNYSDLDLTSLRQEIDSDNLFSSKKVIVIQGLVSATKSKVREEMIKIISNNDHAEVILYETKELTPTSLKLFPGSTGQVFKVNPVIFKLMDSLRPGQQKTIFSLYDQTIAAGQDVEFVYAMLVRQVRLLIQVKGNPNAVRLAPFAKRLFQTQSQYFDMEKLTDMHHKLYLIDRKIKTGSSSATVENLVHHFLLTV